MKDLVASGKLHILGITQEQHSERCRLFAQWKEFDWPILWDPFNLTGSKAVPLAVAVDEWGVVRAVNPRADRFEESFLNVDFPIPAEDEPEPPAPSEHVVQLDSAKEGSFEAAHYGAISDNIAVIRLAFAHAILLNGFPVTYSRF